jgi:predicted DNA-binding transcriptional regulator YafY
MLYNRNELVRVLNIHRAIAEGHFPSAQVLAELCEVDPRTVKRDLKLLREQLNAPVEFDRERGGYRYTHPFSLLPADFDPQEMQALSLVLAIAENFQGISFKDALENALGKLRLLQPTELPAPEGLISCRPAPPAVDQQAIIFFNQLLNAIRDRRRVRMVYHSQYNDTIKEREVDPHHLYHCAGLWYLHAYCHWRQELRDFAVCRLQRLELLSQTFPAPNPARFQEWLQHCFLNMHDQDGPQEVRIRFSQPVVRLISERLWHPSQQLAMHPDGACTLTMTVTGLPSVMRWVLGYGRHARVLAPDALVRMVRQEVAAMVMPGE